MERKPPMAALELSEFCGKSGLTPSLQSAERTAALRSALRTASAVAGFGVDWASMSEVKAESRKSEPAPVLLTEPISSKLVM